MNTPNNPPALSEMVRNSKWFREGYDTAKNTDLPWEAVPYAVNSPKWILWVEGYLAAKSE